MKALRLSVWCALVALTGALLGAAPLLLFLARWRPCVVLCWPE